MSSDLTFITNEKNQNLKGDSMKTRKTRISKDRKEINLALEALAQAIVRDYSPKQIKRIFKS